MGVTGITENKLFKVRTIDQNNPYQVGVNNVIDISESSGGRVKIKYLIDDIEYTSYLSENDNFLKTPYIDKGRKKYLQKLNKSDSYSISSTGFISQEKIKGSDRLRNVTTAGNLNLNRFTKPKITIPELSSVGDTIYVTPKYSYDDFIFGNIYKKEKYVGLIDHPIVESDLFIERDEYTIFERHQRLSEINNLAELVNYRGGYFENIKTL